MTLGERLKTLRKKKNWTLKYVASKLQLSSHSTYSNWEYNRTQPDLDMLNRLAELYEVSVDYLTKGKEEITEVNEDDSPIPEAVKAWLRTDVEGLTNKEQEILAEDLTSYFKMRKQRILDKKNES